MITCIPDVLNSEELKKLRDEAAKLPFVPGAETAGARARRVKNNEQVSQKADERKPLHEIVINALMRSRDFARAAQPKRIRPPLISRYREGMAYGKHVDNALMGPRSARERSDVSVTLFISDLTEYDGGELVMHSAFGVQEVKLPAGWVVAYPSSTLHEVTEVTRGERLVAVTWVQSYVRDDRQREIISNLAQIKEKLNEIAPDDAATDLANHTYSNLLRMWAET
jgi:PKHD-type hydroxylase